MFHVFLGNILDEFFECELFKSAIGVLGLKLCPIARRRILEPILQIFTESLRPLGVELGASDATSSRLNSEKYKISSLT
jgi:hypothetical protein